MVEESTTPKPGLALTVPPFVLVLLSFLLMTPVGKTAGKIREALEDGTVTTPEIGGILEQAALDAQALVPGDSPEEQLAVDVTKDLAAYFRIKFPETA